MPSVQDALKSAGVSTVSMPVAGPGAPLDIHLFDSDAQQIAARTIIMYGQSGLGKSTNAKFFSMREYELSQHPVRLISAEDSSKTIFQPLIDAGIVQPLFVSKANNPLVVLRKCAKGDWPVFNKDGTIAKWQAITDWRGEVSAYVIEGLTSWAEQLLEFFREQGWFMREQKSDAIETMSEKVSPSSQTAYGIAQMEMLRAVKSFGMLPVERVLWTAHESAGSEEDTKEPIRGPGLVGRAGTSAVQKFCGLLLHVDGIKEGNTAILKPRMYFKRHLDSKMPTISYPAKTTVPSEMLTQLEKAYPGGYFDPGTEYGTGLDKFISLESELIKTATDQLTKWKVDLQQKKENK